MFTKAELCIFFWCPGSRLRYAEKSAGIVHISSAVVSPLPAEVSIRRQLLPLNNFIG
jgi:hypothetical protein